LLKESHFFSKILTYFTWILYNFTTKTHGIGGVMASMLASSAIDSSSSDQMKQKTIKLVFVAYTLSTHHYGGLEQKLVGQYNVSAWSDMSTSGLLFQWANTIKIQLRMLILYKAGIISSNVTCSRHDMAEKFPIWR
jgi:hypothetical protein